jgi:large conductance mechanosensitive channel
MPNFDAAEAEIERWRAITGKPDFSAIEFTINGSKFPIGDFINALVSFILIAAAVYFFMCCR